MRPDFGRLRAVLLDLDGTLVETHIDFPAMTRAILKLTSEAGVAPEITAGRDILGMVEAATAFLAAQDGDGAALRRAAFAQLEAMEIQGCSQPLLLPGADRLLGQLAGRGVKVGIVTRNCRTVAASLVARFALSHDLLLTRDDVRLTKPHPEHLWDALRRLNEAPGDAAMVGDHPMDIQAGRDAGCAVTIGVLGRHRREYFAACPPTVIVHNPEEALPLFA